MCRFILLGYYKGFDHLLLLSIYYEDYGKMCQFSIEKEAFNFLKNVDYRLIMTAADDQAL